MHFGAGDILLCILYFLIEQQISNEERLGWIFHTPHKRLNLISRQKIFFIFSGVNRMYARQMLIWEESLRLSNEGGFISLQFGHIEIFPCGFYNFFFCFFEYFPQFDIFGVGSHDFDVFSLILHPVDAGDLLLNIHAPQRIKLSHMRLKLSVVLKLLILFLGVLGCLENDDSPCPISECQKPARMIELHDGDDVFFHDFFIGAFVSKDLGVFVVSAFASRYFLHSSIQKSDQIIDNQVIEILNQNRIGVSSHKYKNQSKNCCTSLLRFSITCSSDNPSLASISKIVAL